MTEDIAIAAVVAFVALVSGSTSALVFVERAKPNLVYPGAVAGTLFVPMILTCMASLSYVNVGVWELSWSPVVCALVLLGWYQIVAGTLHRLPHRMLFLLRTWVYSGCAFVFLMAALGLAT